MKAKTANVTSMISLLSIASLGTVQSAVEAQCSTIYLQSPFSEMSSAEAQDLRSLEFADDLAHLTKAPIDMVIKQSVIAEPTAEYKMELNSKLCSAFRKGLDRLDDHYIVEFHEDLFPYRIEIAESETGIAEKVTMDGYTVSALADKLTSDLGINVDFLWSRAGAGFSATMSAIQAEKLREAPQVKAVVQDPIVRLTVDQDVSTSGDNAWALDRIDQDNILNELVYRYFYDGTGVNIYVFDTGINLNHTEFSGRISSYYDAVGSGIQDGHGHGSNVAGIAMGTRWGVAKNANLIPVKTFNFYGVGLASWVIAGINWAVIDHSSSERAVANMSFNLPIDGWDGVSAKVLDLWNDNVFISAAAGNGYGAVSGYDQPTDVSQIMVVGSIGSSDYRSSFSSRGARVDIWAPGEGIKGAHRTNNNDFYPLTGTSQASPLVAGLAACVLEEYPLLSASQVKNHLISMSAKNKVGGLNAYENNRVARYLNWFYPFHNLVEWQNSDTSYASTNVYVYHFGNLDGAGGTWLTIDPSSYPSIYRWADNVWLSYSATPHDWWFYNYSTSSWEVVFE